MRIPPALRRLTRAWAFVRHIPPRKILRRLILQVRRLLRDRIGWPKPRTAVRPALARSPPPPVFPPRQGMVTSDDGRLSFRFLGRSHAMLEPIEWDAPGRAPDLQLWRMNLHYMEYLEETDATLGLSLISEWIDANADCAPGAWKDGWNSYALSIRIVVWMQQLTRRDWLQAPASLHRMLDSLAVQIRFLVDNLETDLGGNHLVKNIKALLWSSGFFAGPEADRWRSVALRLLDDALKEQILGDGVHYERSPSYHCQVFADLLECRVALANVTRHTRLDDALARMAQAVADLSHPDGSIAQFNDAGLTMAYSPDICLDVFENLFGTRPAPRARFGFADAGYFGLREGGAYFVADCGRIAPDELPAHGHGDILSFEWSVGGERIIVDPGVFEYVAGDRRRRSRAASSHNTLCFEGSDQADFYGAFRCGRRPAATVSRFVTDEAGVVLEGTHDGFDRLPGAPRHWRRFEASANQIRITDRLTGRPDRKAWLTFLFHPDVRIAEDDGGLWISRGIAAIRMTSQARIEVQDSIWWPDLGVERQTKCARIAVAPGSSEVITMLRVNSDQEAV